MKKLIVTAALAGMMLTTVPLFAQGTSPPAGDQEAKHMQQMQTHMQQMQTQMDKINQIQDPEERYRLMQEHIKSMQEGMQTLHKMSGGTLEQRVNALEMMMEQLLWHQKAVTGERSRHFKEK